jgi:pimeloyl-ACP methyl ester carboxylesterase
MIGHHICGSGPRHVLVLHGWLGDHKVFEPMLPYLDGESFTYAFMDYRGYGLSREMAGRYDMAEISADAQELVDRLGWSTFHLVGHSMGGMAIQRVLADRPAQIASAIAITPVPASGVPHDEGTRALFEGATGSDDNRRTIIDVTTGGRLSRTWLDYMVRRSRDVSSTTAFAAYYNAWSQTNFAAEVEGLETPFLVLVGETDAALTADVMEGTYLRFYPHAKLETMSNAGHYPMQELPVWLATRIESFLLSGR